MTRPGDLARVGAASLAAAGSVGVLAWAAWGPRPSLPGWEVGAAVLDLVPVALGWLLVRAAPGSPVGPALAWVGGATLVVRAVEEVGSRPDAPPVAAALAPGVWSWQFLGLLGLLLVFPGGLLPGRRWRVVAAAGPVAALLVTAGLAQGPPEGPPPLVGLLLAGTGALLLLATLAAAVVGLVLRSRRGGESTRRQLRWLLLAGAAVPVLLAAGWGLETTGLPVGLAYLGPQLAMLLLVPAAVAVAVLRHDLLDVDRLLGGTVAGAVTAVLAAAGYAAVVALVSGLATASVQVSSATAAFVTALALLPLHSRVQALVARWTDRERTVTLAAVRRFVEDVRDGRAAPESVQQVLAGSLGDPALRLGLLLPGRTVPVDLDGTPLEVGGAGVVALRGADTEVGVLVLGRDSARRRRLAAEAAREARLPIEVSRLRLELRASLAEVTASRARLVHAATAERRRLERDLHDGAQQRVVAVGMRLRSLQRRLADPVVDAELDLAVDGLQETVDELRRVAAGLRPGRLDDGLAAALAGLVRDSPVPVRLRVEDGGADDLDETTGTTAWFVVAEALANAWKHAGATEVAVTVAREGGGRTRVEVRDDGVGGVPRDGALLALRDRVGSVGGRLEVTSPPGRGTTVTAVV